MGNLIQVKKDGVLDIKGEHMKQITIGEKSRRVHTDIYGHQMVSNHPCLLAGIESNSTLYVGVACFEWGLSVQLKSADRRGALHSIIGCSHPGVSAYQGQYRLFSDGYYDLYVFRGDMHDIWV